MRSSNPLLWLASYLLSTVALAGEPAPKPGPLPGKKQGAPASKEGQEAKNKRQKKEFEQLDIWAERIIYHGKSGKFLFSRNVTVIKGTLRIDCMEMEGLLDPKTRKLTKVTAFGDVRLITIIAVAVGPDGRPTVTTGEDAWRGTCSQADYDLKGGRITMTGTPGKARPRLWRGKRYGEADTIIFEPDKGEYELIGDPVIRGDLPSGPAKKTPKPSPK